MLGFIIGTISLFALIRVVRRARAHRRGFDRSGYGPRHAGPFGELLARLRATPEQEKALREAAGELRGTGGTAFAALRESRREYARAFAGDVFDESALAPAYSAQDEALTTFHRALAGALLKAHGALEPDQRARLAAWISSRALPDLGPSPALAATATEGASTL